MTERYKFNFLLRQDKVYKAQDEYQRHCNKTSSNSQLHHLGCSQCLITHNSCYFSTGQLSPKTSPKTRICAGLEGYVELCEHFSWSVECLWRGFRVLEGLQLRCSYEHNHDVYRNVYGIVSTPMLNLVLRYFPDAIVMHRSFPLFLVRNVSGSS